MTLSLKWRCSKCSATQYHSERDFYTEQYSNTKSVILELLKFGQASNAITAQNIDDLADSIMFLFEGLRSKAISSGISPELAERQLDFCKRMIFSNIFSR